MKTKNSRIEEIQAYGWPIDPTPFGRLRLCLSKGLCISKPTDPTGSEAHAEIKDTYLLEFLDLPGYRCFP